MKSSARMGVKKNIYFTPYTVKGICSLNDSFLKGLSDSQLQESPVEWIISPRVKYSMGPVGQPIHRLARTSPFLSVSSLYKETQSILKLRCPHLVRSQKHFIPGNPQPTLSPKKHRNQKTRNRKSTQQRPDQILAPIIEIISQKNANTRAKAQSTTSQFVSTKIQHPYYIRPREMQYS